MRGGGWKDWSQVLNSCFNNISSGEKPLQQISQSFCQSLLDITGRTIHNIFSTRGVPILFHSNNSTKRILSFQESSLQPPMRRSGGNTRSPSRNISSTTELGTLSTVWSSSVARFSICSTAGCRSTWWTVSWVESSPLMAYKFCILQL